MEMYSKQGIAELRRSSDAEIAAELLEPAGGRILDIGCGEGNLTCALARLGAEVTGVDPNAGQIERARAAASEQGLSVTFEVGIGEDLPFADASCDVALLSNSLHHVPEDRMGATLEDAARVVKPGGLLYVMEPVPEGPYFEVQRVWNDETRARARAFEMLAGLGKLGFEMVAEVFYTSARSFADHGAYVARSASRHERRRAEIESKSAEIRERFLANAVKSDDGFALDMIFRVDLARKRV